MITPRLLLLYVADARRSAAFWADLIGTRPVELSDTFAMLPLRDGLMLGLWTIDGVAPAATITGGGGEIAVAVASDAAVDATHADWSARGLTILQAPTAMDFGRTFTAADPDGHRIRVYHPAG
ncbi:VOC family protein [Pinisolibacter aquiterrae]|jgi:catechol 2,3-dioxygenase-like lactoylglutathione lyase family enzyme|uniref:VOC family protein n=1 Tax=Pinisolibacter aquiterrae TaxID=2815579 RepID=UPI001C3E588E|nr:VOC family protein [Pinisolibacter aquiterrae]MBV5263538.1 VOC family protein [Pinisolibacter aquiterrae]MCC8237408.1 VOC family protein [Pinisolibacter aquiterrae]